MLQNDDIQKQLKDMSHTSILSNKMMYLEGYQNLCLSMCQKNMSLVSHLIKFRESRKI